MNRPCNFPYECELWFYVFLNCLLKQMSRCKFRNWNIWQIQFNLNQRQQNKMQYQKQNNYTYSFF